MNKTLGNVFKGDKVIWMVFFFLCIISVVEVFSDLQRRTLLGTHAEAHWYLVAGYLLYGCHAEHPVSLF